MPSHAGESAGRETFAVSDELFKRVYDSPRSLPGRHVWLTPSEDVRELERLIGIEPGTVGAPLWLSGDEPECRECRRRLSWLDIVASAVSDVHSKELIVRVMLGEQRFVNVEAPDAIQGVKCHNCGAAVEALRSFKCHNWAYAVGDLADVVRRLRTAAS